MKKTILSLAFIAIAFLVKAQIGIGVSTSYNLFFGGGVGGDLGIGALGEYGFKEGKYSGRASFNYFLPKTYSGSVDAVASSSSTSPSSVSVPYTDKLSIMSICFDGKRYFKDGNMADGGLYAGAGACLFLARVNTTYASYDSQNYILNSASGSTGYSQWMLRGLFGYEKVMDFGALFGELQLTVPATKVNGQDVTEINIPGSLGLAVGYKYIIGK